MPQRQNARAGMHGFASQARTLLSGVPALERSVRAAEATVWMPIGKDTVAVLTSGAPWEVGGLERVVQALATGQGGAGHRVSVVAVLRNGREGHPFVRALSEAGVDVVPLHLPPRAYLNERSAVDEICRRIRPDVVHTHGYHVDVVDAGVARRHRVPTVTTVHGFTGGDLKNRIYEGLQRRAFHRFDAVVAVSRPLAGELARAGVPAARLHVGPNAWPGGAPPLPRDHARWRLARPEERFPVGWGGPSPTSCRHMKRCSYRLTIPGRWLPPFGACTRTLLRPWRAPVARGSDW